MIFLALYLSFFVFPLMNSFNLSNAYTLHAHSDCLIHHDLSLSPLIAKIHHDDSHTKEKQGTKSRLEYFLFHIVLISITFFAKAFLLYCSQFFFNDFHPVLLIVRAGIGLPYNLSILIHKEGLRKSLNPIESAVKITLVRH